MFWIIARSINHPFESTLTHVRTDSVVSSPVHLWLVVQPEDQVGEQLEEVLPQEQSHVKVNVAYVRLAHVSSVAHVAHADKLVDEVAAIASIQTRVGLALVDLLLAPETTASQKNSDHSHTSMKCR